MITVAGLIVAMNTRNSKRGGKLAFITLDDRSGRIELVVFPEDYERYRDLLVKDRLLVVEGDVSVDEYSGGYRVSAREIYDIEGYRVSAREIYDIEGARSRFAKRLVIAVEQKRAGNGFIHSLAETLEPYREGGCPVAIDYRHVSASATVILGDQWRVRPADLLLQKLADLAGENRVRLEY